MSLVKSLKKTQNKLRQLKYDLGYDFYDLWRIFTQKKDLLEIVNQKEIRIVGLRRSGNHAIINWIRKQATGKVRHLNNIPAQKNPYRVLYQHYPKERLQLDAIGKFLKLDCLLYSYEDYALSQITDWRFEKKHELYFGRSSVRYDVIILRDPFNLIASRLKQGYLKVKAPEQTIINLWLEYAKEFLGETQYLKNNKLCINYNRWFIDYKYRQQLATKLKLEFTDTGINEVKPQGGGSSFEGLKLNGKANEMKVLDRWKNFVYHPLYREVLNNQELIAYSEKIFGHILDRGFT